MEIAQDWFLLKLIACVTGAPSLVNGNGAVGATDLLRGPSEVFEVDLSMPTAQLAQQVSSYILLQSASGMEGSASWMARC